MKSDALALGDGDALVQSLAAELASVAYPVVLRHASGGSWIELELGLWCSLAETVARWTPELPCAASADQFAGWREGVVADLTRGALSVARQPGRDGPLPEMASGLDRAFRSVIGPVRPMD